MNTFQKALRLGIDGESPAEVVAKLTAVTHSDLPILELKNYFREQGLWKKNPITGAMTGRLTDAYNDPVFGAQLRVVQDALDDLFTALYEVTTNHLTTATNADIAKQTRDIIHLLQTGGHVTAADADGMHAIGGGLVYPAGLTEAQYEADKAAYEQQVAQEQLKGETFEWLNGQVRVLTDAIDAGEHDHATLIAMMQE